MSLKKRVDSLQEKYVVNIEEFMELYTSKMRKETMGEELHLSLHAVEKIAAELRLKWPKSKRAKCRVSYLIELNVDTTNEAKPNEELLRENEYLSHKLSVSSRALQRSRDEANHLRSEVRKSNRRSSANDEVLDIIKGALPIKRTGDISVTLAIPSVNYEEHTSCILLSDLHVEESVSRKDVGNTNEYTWEIMKERLDVVFAAWFDAWRGERKGVVILGGDLFTGFIHDALENASKHPMEAVQELADILSDYVRTASIFFDEVHVPIVNGNHGRLTDKIKSAAKGLDLEYVFGHILKAKLGTCKNVNVEVTTTGYAVVDVGMKKLGVHHGDHFRSSVHTESRTFKVYEGFKNVCGQDVDHICQGHTHQFSHSNTHKGSIIVNGSLIGSNSYGVTSGFVALRPSQTLMSFTPQGEVDIVEQIFVD